MPSAMIDFSWVTEKAGLDQRTGMPALPKIENGWSL